MQYVETPNDSRNADYRDGYRRANFPNFGAEAALIGGQANISQGSKAVTHVPKNWKHGNGKQVSNWLY